MIDPRLIEWAQTLDFPALACVVLYLGWKQTWVWGHQLVKVEAVLTSTIVEAKADAEYWRKSFFIVTNLAEQMAERKP